MNRNEDAEQGNDLQKRVNSIFTGLQNPTLPSAGKLCREAIDSGFQVDQKVINRIIQHEGCWQ